ncbi:MAG: hypothetical protein AAGL98_16015, partial [Planctomycetota bacterium]
RRLGVDLTDFEGNDDACRWAERKYDSFSSSQRQFLWDHAAGIEIEVASDDPAWELPEVFAVSNDGNIRAGHVRVPSGIPGFITDQIRPALWNGANGTMTVFNDPLDPDGNRPERFIHATDDGSLLIASGRGAGLYAYTQAGGMLPLIDYLDEAYGVELPSVVTQFRQVLNFAQDGSSITLRTNNNVGERQLHIQLADSTIVSAGNAAVVTSVVGLDEPGGVRGVLEDPQAGTFTSSYRKVRRSWFSRSYSQAVADGFEFWLNGQNGRYQTWELDFTGDFDEATLTFAYDETLLGSYLQSRQDLLGIYHFTAGAWQRLPTFVDEEAKTLTVTVTDFSP